MSSFSTRVAWHFACVFMLLLATPVACQGGVSSHSQTPFLVESKGSIFEQIDGNGDGKLGFEAFHRGLSFHYYFRQGLDLDGDDIMQYPEITTASFELWDVNDDGALSPAEWMTGMSVWFPNRASEQSFADWDLDGDGMLSVIELGDGALRSQIFDAYDLNHDGIIETREASGYLFSHWDRNHDGVIEVSEWPL
ncbi:MAG: hypothetical protein PVH21_06575 [Myxococcales bacterium]